MKRILGVLLALNMSICMGNNHQDMYKNPSSLSASSGHSHGKCGDLPVKYHYYTMGKVKDAFDLANSTIDYLLTAKGAVKTMVLLTPLFMVYCRYFDVDPVQALMNKIIQSVGKAKEMYEMQRRIGESQAFWEIIWTQPWDTFCVTAQNIAKKTVDVGLPFVAGLWIKGQMGIK